MILRNLISGFLFLYFVQAGDDDYNNVNPDGSFEFGYNNPDSYHYAQGDRRNVVKGEFGGRSPKTGAIDTTVYTAGPRGYRPRGKNIARKFDLSQNGPRPIGSSDDPYFDPYEDPSYSFSFRTRTHTRAENANRLGDVNGKYSFIDDVGERHNVEYVAGKRTGFFVKTPFPDSNPRATGPLFFNGRGKPIPRGRTSIQHGADGSYRFVSAGPDQRRSETSDSSGHVRGSYTYLDDKGVQHSVHYIAGPETGYRVLKNVKGPHLPTIYPFNRPDIIPPDFYDPDVFDTAASGHIPPGNHNGPNNNHNKPSSSGSGGGDSDDQNDDNVGRPSTGRPGSRPSRPKPSTSSIFNTDTDDDINDNDLFASGESNNKPGSQSSEENIPFRPNRPSGGGSSGAGSTVRPGGSSSSHRPPIPIRPFRPNRPRPRPPRPFDPSDDDDLDINEGLFGGNFGSKPSGSGTTSGSGSSRPKPGNIPRPITPGGTGSDHPVLQIGSTTGSGSCPNCKGTIVRNLGSKTFQVPPGVAVRAHVQQIDLVPADTKIPAPSDQYKAETNISPRQLVGVSENSSAASEEDESTTTVSSSTESDELKL